MTPQTTSRARFFYSPGAIGEIRVDRACIVNYHESADSFIIALADPTFTPASVVRVTVAEPLTSASLQSGVSAVVQGDSTVITFSVDNGGSYAGRFARQWNSRAKGVITVLNETGDTTIADAEVTVYQAGHLISRDSRINWAG